MRFIDVHSGMQGVTQDELMAAHQRDLDIQGDEDVKFLHAWADPKTGKVFCLSEAPNAEAVRRVHQRAGHDSDEIYEVPIEVE